MALTDKKLLKIKVDYEAGRLTKSQIGKKHAISQPTLRKHAEDQVWKFQKNFQEVSEIVEKKSIERLIEREVDKTVKITDQFLQDLDKYRKLTMYPVSEVARAIQEVGSKGKVSKEEYDRIFAGSKINKINIEALNVAYTGARKALGMDKGPKDNPDSDDLEDIIKRNMERDGFKY